MRSKVCHEGEDPQATRRYWPSGKGQGLQERLLGRLCELRDHSKRIKLSSVSSKWGSISFPTCLLSLGFPLVVVVVVGSGGQESTDTKVWNPFTEEPSPEMALLVPMPDRQPCFGGLLHWEGASLRTLWHNCTTF